MLFQFISDCSRRISNTFLTSQSIVIGLFHYWKIVLCSEQNNNNYWQNVTITTMLVMIPRIVAVRILISLILSQSTVICSSTNSCSFCTGTSHRVQQHTSNNLGFPQILQGSSKVNLQIKEVRQEAPFSSTMKTQTFNSLGVKAEVEQ